MAVGKPLYAAGRIELRPFSAQYGDSVALAAQFAAQLGHAFSLKGGVELDLVHKRSCQDQRSDNQDIEKAHDLPALQCVGQRRYTGQQIR